MNLRLGDILDDRLPFIRKVHDLDDARASRGAGLRQEAVERAGRHTTGNQTIFVHGDHGVFGCSENGTCADNWSPHHSRLRGVRSAAMLLDLEVVLNSNTPELAAEQYTSMLLERALVDRVKGNSAFYQMFPSSEVTRSFIAPYIRATHTFGAMESGSVQVRRDGAAAPAQAAE